MILGRALAALTVGAICLAAVGCEQPASQKTGAAKAAAAKPFQPPQLEWTDNAWWEAREIAGPNLDDSDPELKQRLARARAFVDSRSGRIYPDTSLADQFWLSPRGPEYLYRLPSGRVLQEWYAHPLHGSGSAILTSPEGDVLAVGFVWVGSLRWKRPNNQGGWLPPGSTTKMTEKEARGEIRYLTVLVRPDLSRDDYVRTLSAWANAKWRIYDSPEILWL